MNTARSFQMRANMNRISFEDWIAGFPPETQQAIQDGGDALIARYNAEVEWSVAAKRLHEQCQTALVQLVITWYKMGMYLNVCKGEVGDEGLLHVLEEAEISEDNAQAFLQLWEDCSATTAIRDWLEVADTVSGSAEGGSVQLPLDFASMVKPQLSETESGEFVLETLLELV